MNQHEANKSVLTPGDLDEHQRNVIIENAGHVFDDEPEIDLVESERGTLELVVPNQLAPADQDDLCREIAEQLTGRLDRGETITLVRREGWPNSTYEICIERE